MACNPGQSTEIPCASLKRLPRRKEREQESQIIPLDTREAEQRQPVFTKDKLKIITVVCTPQLAESLKMYYRMCLHVCTCLCVKRYQAIKHPCLKDVLQTFADLFWAFWWVNPLCSHLPCSSKLLREIQTPSGHCHFFTFSSPFLPSTQAQRSQLFSNLSSQLQDTAFPQNEAYPLQPSHPHPPSPADQRREDSAVLRCHCGWKDKGCSPRFG